MNYSIRKNQLYFLCLINGIGQMIEKLHIKIFTQPVNFLTYGCMVQPNRQLISIQKSLLSPLFRRSPTDDQKQFSQNILNKCITCQLSQCACLTRTFQIETRSDNSKHTVRYDIDMTKCIYCGFCQEAC